VRKQRLRLSILFLLLSFFVLVDEAIKEGYVFDPRDVVSPSITHEKIFLLLFVIGMILGLRRSYKRE